MSACLFAPGPFDPALGGVAKTKNGENARIRELRDACRRKAFPSFVGNCGIRHGILASRECVPSGFPHSVACGPRAGADPVSRRMGGRGRSVPPRVAPEIVGRDVLMDAVAKAPARGGCGMAAPIPVESIEMKIQVHRNDRSDRGIWASPCFWRLAPIDGSMARMVLSTRVSPKRDRRTNTCSEA